MIDRWKQKSKYKHQHTFIIQKEYHGNGHDAFYHFITIISILLIL